MLVKKIHRAARACENPANPNGASIVLPNEADQRIVMKEVVQRASAIVREWHVLRAYDEEAVEMMETATCPGFQAQRSICSFFLRLPFPRYTLRLGYLGGRHQRSNCVPERGGLIAQFLL